MINRELHKKLSDETKKFHQANKTKIKIQKTADEYRGALDCEEIREQVRFGDYREDTNSVSESVYKDGVFVGTMVKYYGSNGQGKLASSSFSPAEGVELIWINN